MTDILISKDDGQIVTLTLNDAPANCLTMEMMSAIQLEITVLANLRNIKWWFLKVQMIKFFVVDIVLKK